MLVALGILHLAVTHHIVELLDNNAEAWLKPPMLLNHVVVGLLLLPLGALTYYAAADAAGGVNWAIVVCRTTAATVATLPLAVFALMGRAYFGAPAFLVATALVTASAIVLNFAAFWPVREVAG